MKNIRLIGAGAGSGKTYRLSLEVFQGISAEEFRPNGIMLTTFTRRAASELRGRVGAMLIEKGMVEQSHLLGQSLIGTVHGICAGLLKDYAFECGLAMEQNVLEPTDAAKLFRRALANGLTYAEQEHLHKLCYVIEIEDWQETVQHLSELVRVNQIDPGTLAKWARRSVDSLLDGVVENPTGRQGLLAAVLSYQKLIEETIGNGEDNTKVTKDCVAALKRAAKELQKTQMIRWKDVQTLQSKAPGRRNQHFPKMAEIQHQANQNYTWPEIRRDMYEISGRIFDAVEKAIKAYDLLKSEIGAVDYIDLEVMLLKALDNQTVRESLATRIDILMVDEFQDTSPIQMAIFLKMAEVIRNVVWVGDPKQAIYGFRGTDPDLMMTAMTEINRSRKPERLETSWRSRPELVAFVNSTFKDVFRPLGQSPDDVCLKPQRVVELDSKALESWVLLPIPDEEGGRPHQNVGTDHEQIASAIKKVLEDGTHPVIDRETKRTRPIEPRDIAILVRANATAAEMAHAMRAYSIPCEVAIAGLLNEPVVRCVISSINLLLNPEDNFSAAEVAYLHSVYQSGSRTNEDWIEGCVGDPTHPGQDALQLLKDRSASVKSLPALGLFDLAVELSGAVDITHAHEIPSIAKFHVEQLRHIVAEFLNRQAGSGKPATIRTALAYLDEQADNEEDRIRPIAANAIQILTYHGAKGLEWPMVILYEMHKQYEAAPFDARIVTPVTIDMHHPLKDRGVIYWPYLYGRLGKKDDGSFEFMNMVHEKNEYGVMARKRQEEETRLLYVAMTRARDYMVVAARKDKLQALGVLLTANGDPTLEVPQASGDKDWTVIEPIPDGEPLKYDRSKDLMWFRYQSKGTARPGRITPSKLSSAENEGPLASAGKVVPYGERITVKGFDDYEIVGNALHAYLAVDTVGLREDARRELAGDILAAYGLAGHMDARDVVGQAQRLEGWIQSCWPGAQEYRETPLRQISDGVIVQGFADLIIETDKGFVIIDHKSYPGSMSALSERAVRYSVQLTAYKELVQRATGKSVLGCYINFFTVGAMVELFSSRS